MSFVIAAPASGSGKTTLTLGLLRALSRAGVTVRAAKSGPDYIDPRFHAAACGTACLNLDAWAMTAERIAALAAGDAPLIVEGAMGLFDGAPPLGQGSTADLARILNLPVFLVIDAARMAQSVAPLVRGFAMHDPRIHVAGVILNRVGSDRHAALLRHALAPTGIPVLGHLLRDPNLAQPARHLGLVQAQERPDLEQFLDAAADAVAKAIDLSALPLTTPPTPTPTPTPIAPAPTAGQLQPPAQSIAIAQDRAFAFAYPHMLRDWQQAGATLTTFSPLANDPVPPADLVILPGGYPELHAGRLAANTVFLDGLAAHAGQIYGECGGYMTLGDGLIDADGVRHQMAGLLPVETSFETRKLHLGYRRLSAASGPFAGNWTGHEFHYATTLSAKGTALFEAKDATGADLPPMGLIKGRVSGSFAHLIDRA